MEKITDEIIINSLFMCGYDRVDLYSYSYVLYNIVCNQENANIFEYVKTNSTKLFGELVECNNGVYKIKSEEDLCKVSVDIVPNSCFKTPLDYFQKNNKLVECILKIDPVELVRNKMAFYGPCSYYEFDECFSTKEREIRTEKLGSHYKSVIRGLPNDEVAVRLRNLKKEEDK